MRPLLMHRELHTVNYHRVHFHKSSHGHIKCLDAVHRQLSPAKPHKDHDIVVQRQDPLTGAGMILQETNFHFPRFCDVADRNRGQHIFSEIQRDQIRAKAPHWKSSRLHLLAVQEILVHSVSAECLLIQLLYIYCLQSDSPLTKKLKFSPRHSQESALRFGRRQTSTTGTWQPLTLSRCFAAERFTESA